MQNWHLSAQIKCTIGQHSSAGIKPRNEDCIGIRIPDQQLQSTKGIAAIITDGVSASEAGKEASEICVQGFLSDYYSTPDIWPVKKSGQQVLTALNRWLYSLGTGYISEERGYLCTFSSVIFKSRTAHIFHAGDSRIYLYRDGQLEQLTQDHARKIDGKNSYLTRAMGLDPSLEMDYRQLDIEEGDSFLLTTDGIHDFITFDKLQSTMGSGEEPEAICQAMTELALANQSNDNLSCQVIRLDQLPGKDILETHRQLVALPFPPELEPGMSMDGYNIIRTIHASSRSQLYVVENQQGERFCMKTPSANFNDDPAYIERFSLESWIGQRIQSPHVVKVIEPEQPKNFLYYLTEYVDGITLTQWIKENPLPAMTEVVYLVAQIAKGIRAFHRKEIIHQDIKPDNILISSEGVVKIIDFGSCYSASIGEIATPIERETALGTATYAAPDQILRTKVTAASDIFSLAVVSYEMITGKQPFHGKLEHCQTSQDYLRTKYASAFQYNPLVPQWMDGALRKSLRFQPQRRYQDVDEFIHDLKHPNLDFLKDEQKALLERNPVIFWKALSSILGITCLLLLLQLTR